MDFDPSKPLGLTLKDLRVGFTYATTEGTSRVLVADVLDGGQAAAFPCIWKLVIMEEVLLD